ncbi:hypothetical protein [Mycobacterium phage Maco2]|uniref:Uncharacterized protein n=1 Tax=Mycobacterium phage Maco2 TaxID=2805749 RepID=A0A899IM64_9CAUD|nr:hypothetical protein [Mycobacterium phage Maco2]
MTTALTLPVLPSLLRHEGYAEYFKRNIRCFRSTDPNKWQIVAVTHEGKWRNGFRPDFRTSWEATKKLWHSGEYADIAIIARNRVFSTPHALAEELCAPGQEWCGRCRRPTEFRLYLKTHHALKHAPVIVPGLMRCYYCGISREAALNTYGKG